MDHRMWVTGVLEEEKWKERIIERNDNNNIYRRINKH